MRGKLLLANMHSLTAEYELSMRGITMGLRTKDEMNKEKNLGYQRHWARMQTSKCDLGTEKVVMMKKNEELTVTEQREKKDYM